MHADDFRQDRYGVVSGLKDGGYSDDMTLAAISGTFLALLSNFFMYILSLYTTTSSLVIENNDYLKIDP